MRSRLHASARWMISPWGFFTNHACGQTFFISLLMLSAACSTTPKQAQNTYQATLESWVVLGHGRHLRLSIDNHSPGNEPPIIVEFTTALLRADYTPPANPELGYRLARMTLGDILKPFIENDSLRIEATYTITAAQYQSITRDRVYKSQYFLLGPNSNSAMRDCLQGAGLSLPDHVLTSGGPLGDFPGIHRDTGPELPHADWARHGIDTNEK